MRVAYLVNQYPSVSHTFIRREIEALERLGVEVLRFSIRRMDPATLPDERDRAEAGRTRSLLGGGPQGLVSPLARTAARRPKQFAEAAAMSVKLGSHSERGMLRNQAYLAEACTLLETLEAEPEPVDHVHAHFGTNSAAVAMLTRLLGGPPYSFTAHGPEEFEMPRSLCLDHKIRHAAFVVGISSYGRSQLYRYCDPHEWDKVKVVRCGVDRSFLDASTPVPDTDRLVSVGRLSDQKGQLVLVRAAAALRREGRSFRLVLVGDGPDRAMLEELIAAEDLGEHVMITGWASGPEVRAHLQESRAMVMASFAEGLPVVLMEALGLGRPVVTTWVNGIPELVEPGVNGWLVPASSVEAMVDALRRVLDTPVDELTAMGRRGAERVRELHDIDRNARELLAAFEAAGR